MIWIYATLVYKKSFLMGKEEYLNTGPSDVRLETVSSVLKVFNLLKESSFNVNSGSVPLTVGVVTPV